MRRRRNAKMKYLPLLWAGLWRKPTRTTLTLLSIVVAFVLFAILAGIDAGFAHTLAVSRLDRLFTDSRFEAPMQISQAEQIARVPGVAIVAPRRVLTGSYQDPKNLMLVVCVDERFFSLRPEILATKAQLATLRKTKTGALIDVSLRDKYGWKVGDKIPLQTDTPQVDGNQTWTFDVVGIVDDANYPGQGGWFIANYEYLDDASAGGKGAVDRFLVRINDTDRAARIGRQIDDLFANSAVPTRTSSEKSRSQAGLQFIGDVKLFTHTVVGAVFFMLLFVTANTMLQSVRERVPEMAVLRALGFTGNAIFCLVIAEAVLLCLTAATLGLVLARIVIPITTPAIEDYLLLLQISWIDILRGFGLAVIVAVISSLYPAWRVRRLSIVDALSRR